ncbi:MAG: 2-phospho-L-lactate transferase CofD family protein, partial [Sphaerospermopsis kisseleviana]
EIREAIARATAPRIYVCNIMTEPGETQGYTVADHIRALDRACGQRLFDAILIQRQPPSPSSLKRYAAENSHPVFFDREEVAGLGCRAVLANVMVEDSEKGSVRHDSQRLARVLLRWYSGWGHK